MPDSPTPQPPPLKGSGSDRPVTLAVVTGAHGVTGEVRLKVFAEDLSAYRIFNAGAFTLKSLREGSNGMIARFAEIPDRNAAERLRGTELSVPRSALPPLAEGEYYHADLLDLLAVSTGGEALGRVVAIDDFGAGDVIEIERPDGKRFMVPMRAEAVPEWDADRLVIDAAFAT
ncbi:16S rRNA processing protein RimM [Sphingomonas gilva]|uniref:Ribosome maturation factor RimM n=1 Tax=Sphingomonas gilva TaxID=2305907 RepID=A0A396RLD4_9SPHN|nr:ribosome maturation factor RimM [Sphingomonas gilva]RHW17110.1 16S rRNA processing protein RimM [Sphingomonas gilva]